MVLIGGFVIFVLIGLGLMFLASLVGSSLPCIAEYEISGTLTKDSTEENIFSLPIKGSDRIVKDLKEIDSNPSVKSLLLIVNSPGGEVYSSVEIYDVIANFSKPVVVYFQQVGASGAYYLAVPSKHIMSHPDALVGSIGVKLDHVNVQGLFEKLGINITSFKGGKYKDILSESREATEEEKQIVASIVNDIYAEFKSAVKKHRGNKINDPDAYEAKIYTGRQALSAGLVDSIGKLSDARKIAFKYADLNETSGRVCDYKEYGKSFKNILSQVIYSFGVTFGKGIFDGMQKTHVGYSDLKSPLVQLN